MAKAKLPRGIRPRGDKWLVDVTVGGVRRTATCDTLAEAEQSRLDMKRGLRAGGAVAAGTAWSLGEAWDRCHASCWSGTRTETGMVHHRKHVVEFFGEDTPITEITTAAMDRWVEHMKVQRNANGTINRKLSNLSKVLSEATKRPESSGLVAKPHVPRVRLRNARLRYLSEQEEQATVQTLAKWGKYDHADTVEVLIDTGLRCGELWRLTRFDLDFDAGVIRVWESKTDLPRSIPMTDRVRVILQHRVRKTDRPFPFNNNWMHAAWDRVRDHLGMSDDKHFVPHILRHTFASRLVQRGVPLQVVQQLLGHSSIVMTMRYANLAPSNLTDAVALLNRPRLHLVADDADVAQVAED